MWGWVDFSCVFCRSRPPKRSAGPTCRSSGDPDTHPNSAKGGDRKRVVEGKGEELGGRRSLKKKKEGKRRCGGGWISVVCSADLDRRRDPPGRPAGRPVTPTLTLIPPKEEIGRESWRERGKNLVVAGALKKKKRGKGDVGVGGFQLCVLPISTAEEIRRADLQVVR